MKIALQDKKAISAFLNKDSYEGRVLISDGITLYASWGRKPPVAKWDKKGKLVIIPTEDKGVRKAQEALSQME